MLTGPRWHQLRKRQLPHLLVEMMSKAWLQGPRMPLPSTFHDVRRLGPSLIGVARLILRCSVCSSTPMAFLIAKSELEKSPLISSSNCRLRDCYTPNFCLGYDASGEIIDPALASRAEWNRVDSCQWAVFAAITEIVVHAVHAECRACDRHDPHASKPAWIHQLRQVACPMVPEPSAAHENYNHRTGHRERQY